MDADAKTQAIEPKKSVGLTARILISLVAGIAVGIVLSMVAPQGSAVNAYVIEGIFYVLG